MLELERLAAVLESPRGWTRETGPGYVIHREPPTDVRLAFAEAVVRGLESDPRTLPCTYLYDSEGSSIFEQITAQPEYYQTRTEDAILVEAAAPLRKRLGSSTVVELGSGSSAKTRNLNVRVQGTKGVVHVSGILTQPALEEDILEVVNGVEGVGSIDTDFESPPVEYMFP